MASPVPHLYSFWCHQFVSLLSLFSQFSGSFGTRSILFDLLPFELYFLVLFFMFCKFFFCLLSPQFFWFNSFLGQEQTLALSEQVNVITGVCAKNAYLCAGEQQWLRAYFKGSWEQRTFFEATNKSSNSSWPIFAKRYQLMAGQACLVRVAKWAWEQTSPWHNQGRTYCLSL